MKTFLLLLFLMPLMGMAQMERMIDQPINSNFLRLPVSIDWKQELQGLADERETFAISSSNLVQGVSNRLLQDSSHYINYYSGTLLDSSYSGTYYNYDAKGKLVLEYNYNKANSYSNKEVNKTEREYDAHGNAVQVIKYQFVNNQYFPVDKTENEYDIAGKLIQSSRIMFTENKPGEFANFIKEENSYEGGNISYIRYMWDTQKNEWVLNSKTNYGLDKDGRQVWRESSSYYNNQWVNDSKIEIVYDGRKIIFQVISHWDSNMGRWENSQKKEYAYDALGKQTKTVDSSWDNIKNLWLAKQKEEYTYTKSGKIASIETFRTEDTNQWIGLQKEENTYDAKNYAVLSQILYWDKEKSQWVDQYKSEYAYNSNYQHTYMIYSFWNETSHLWVPDSKYESIYDSKTYNSKDTNWSWDLETGQWMINSKRESFYSNYDVLDEQIITKNEQVKVFPNPARETFTLEVADIPITQCQLFNAKLQLLENLEVNTGKNTYNISHLKEGIYLLKIRAGGATVVRKIIKVGN